MNTIPEEPNLELLAINAQRGDSLAFRRLVEKTQSMAFALAFRLLANEDDARDAAQESYLRVWGALDRYDPGQRFTTWLYRIVTNVSLDRLRARKRWANMFQRTDMLTVDIPDAETQGDGYANADLAERIQGLTGDLPPKQRAVFVLRDLHDCSTDEVASITGLSVASVKTNLCYARARVRALLNERFGITQEDV